MIKKTYFIWVFLNIVYMNQHLIASKQNEFADAVIIEELQFDHLEKIKILFDNNPDIPYYTSISFDYISYHIRHPDSTRNYVYKDIKNEYICGFLLSSISLGEFYIRALGVDKDYRRLGLATKLLKEAYGFAQQTDFKKMTIRTNNLNALKCYQKFGFKLDDDRSDSNLDDDTLCKSLTIYLLNASSK